MMSNKIKKIHDKFFKKILTDVEVAKSFFISFLDKEVLDLINIDSIQQKDVTFINDELSEAFADVVFRFELRDGSDAIYISILLEHKSNPEKYTPVQVLYYLAHTYYKQVITNRGKLEFILPLVYYHGTENWHYKPLPELFKNLPKNLLKYIPTHQTEFIDLYRVPDEELLMLSNLFLTSAMLALKYGKAPKKLFKKIDLIFGSINEASSKDNLLKSITIYFMQLIEEKDVIVEKAVKELPPKIKDFVMSTYDMILQKGMQKGKQEGIQEGAEKKAIIMIANLLETVQMPIEQVAEVAGVAPDLVNLVQEKMAAGKWKHPKTWTDEEWETYFDKA